MKAKLKSNLLVLFFLSLTAILMISACTITRSHQPDGDPVEQAMQTLQAQATQDYYATIISQLTTQPTGSGGQDATPLIVDPTKINEVPVTTQPPAQTAVPPTQVPTVVFTPTNVPPTPTPKPCYQLSFISDVTIPDGSKIVAGTSFTKTWRIQNSGTCKWDTDLTSYLWMGIKWGLTKFMTFPKMSLLVKP